MLQAHFASATGAGGSADLTATPPLLLKNIGPVTLQCRTVVPGLEDLGSLKATKKCNKPKYLRQPVQAVWHPIRGPLALDGTLPVQLYGRTRGEQWFVAEARFVIDKSASAAYGGGKKPSPPFQIIVLDRLSIQEVSSESDILPLLYRERQGRTTE